MLIVLSVFIIASVLLYFDHRKFHKGVKYCRQYDPYEYVSFADAELDNSVYEEYCYNKCSISCYKHHACIVIRRNR